MTSSFTVEAPATPEIAAYQTTLLTRLVRLLTARPAEFAPGLFQQAVFWAYADCRDAGVGATADILLNKVLGPPEARPELESFVRAAPSLPDPNLCKHCGHASSHHTMASWQHPAVCMACDHNSVKEHAYEGGYVEP